MATGPRSQQRFDGWLLHKRQRHRQHHHLAHLPLDKNKVKKVAVLGPNAAAAGDQLGQYECTSDQSKVVTVEQGIRNVAGVEVTHSLGLIGIIHRRPQ